MEQILEQLIHEGAIDTATELHLNEQFKQADEETKMEVLETLIDLGYLPIADQLAQTIESVSMPELSFTLAELAFLHGDMDTVLLHTSNINKESDVYIKALILEAEVYANIDLQDVSERKIKELRHYLDDSALADLFLAEFYYEQENYDEAYQLYAKLIENPEHSDKVDSAKFASLSYALGEYELALTYFDKVLHPEVMSELQIIEYSDLLLSTEQTDVAIKLLEQYVNENQYNVPNARIRLGQLAIYDNDVDKAKKAIQDGLTHDELNPQLLLFDALLAKKENNMYRFEQQLYKVLETHPENVSALRELVNYKFEQGAYDEIEQLIAQLETQGEYDIIFDWYKAKLLSEKGHLEKALAGYSSIFDEMKVNEQYLNEYAILANELNEEDELRKIVVTAVEHELELSHLELYKGVLSID